MNPILPIHASREQITTAVRQYKVVIVTAETGAGKSTQVPQYLLEAGYRVVVTQPRRLAARSLAARVAEEVGSPLGELVGYRTAEDRQDSAQTRLLFCTDGLQLVRELTGHGAATRNQILVIDELHEWNRNIETLLAWAKRRLTEEPDFQVVLMSATIDTDSLASYFGEAAVISVPGRSFAVEYHHNPSRSLVKTTVELTQQGRNVLVFVPGKAEIETTIAELRLYGLHRMAAILPLHGQQAPVEQRLVYQHYHQPKVIVSTNVAQTSVTIDDIDVVVDSGLERRVEVHDGVEGLYLGDISQADCYQRAGRAGRTKAGQYVLCSDRPIEDRPLSPKPEIERSRLDLLVLRLARADLDAPDLEFYHQPERQALAEAKAALTRLGALDASGRVTPTGHAISRLPVDVHLARMIIEARDRGVLGPVLIIAACLQTGGIRKRGKPASRQWRKLTAEQASDPLAELDCFLAASQLPTNQIEQSGLSLRAYRTAKQLHQSLARRLGVSTEIPHAPFDRQAVLMACVAGMVDHLYRHIRDRSYVGTDGIPREITHSSVVRKGEWVVGQPFDVANTNRHGQVFVIRLLEMVSQVDPNWLAEIAPQLVTDQPPRLEYVPDQRAVCQLVATHFNDQPISRRLTKASPSPVTTRVLAHALATDAVTLPQTQGNRDRLGLVQLAEVRHGQPVGDLNQCLTSWYVDRIHHQLGRPAVILADVADLDLTIQPQDLLPAGWLPSGRDLGTDLVEWEGVEFHIRYTLTTDGTPMALIRFCETELRRVTSLPPVFVSRFEVEIVTATGQPVLRAGDLQRLRRLSEKGGYPIESLADRLAVLEATHDRLAAQGRDVVHLWQQISHCRRFLDQILRYQARPAFLPADQRPRIHRLLEKAEDEASRLEQAPLNVPCPTPD